MGEIITYKNQAGGVFAQIKFDSNERVLVSISTEEMEIKIFELSLELIPTRTVFSISLTQAVDVFLNKEDWNKQGIMLDKVIESIKDSKSISTMKEKIAQKIKASK